MVVRTSGCIVRYLLAWRLAGQVPVAAFRESCISLHLLHWSVFFSLSVFHLIFRHMQKNMFFLFFLILLFPAHPSWADGAESGHRATVESSPVELYFFWTPNCPHCREAQPFVAALAEQVPWLQVHSLDASQPVHAQEYVRLAGELGMEARSVPAFLFCGRMITGFHTAADSGRELLEWLQECRDKGGHLPPAAAGLDGMSAIPGLAGLDPQRLSLPVFTVVIAALDAFNPCAFFVLLFLLSLLVNARARARMLFIGGIFVLFSGLMYFLFMAAWLNLFLWLGELRMVTLLAGSVAVLMALLNIKDYFWFRQGPSLGMPEAVKPGLFRRMRGLLRGENLPALALGTVVLAVVANSYELLCTAGFPMVYTRYLTLADLQPLQHYLYLGLYNLIYVLPLLAIVLAFTWTLGRRKLSESEGRLLKLVSGLMMLGLGLGLLLRPDLINNPLAAISLLLLAVGAGWLVHHLHSSRQAKAAD